MLRPSLTTAAVAVLCTGAMAQTDMSSRLKSITAPVKNAGIYHVATGTWTRHGSIANVTGPDTIYNNTCAPVYFTDMLSTEKYQHRSRIPSLSSPVVATVVPGRPSTDNDSAPGCANDYLVNGFEVAYCSSATIVTDWRYEFANSYQLCGAGDMVPQYTIDVTGLPGGTVTGAQQCWIVNLDISGGTAGGMLLSADGDGTYNGTLDEFGFSFNTTNAALNGTSTGPILAGDFTWTGGPGTVSGVLTPCTGTDGTIWDNPINLAEEGTGMGSMNFFRDAGGPISAPSGPGCYWFGGAPHADFWLKLYADPNCPDPDPLVEFCFPNAGGTRSCPCGNQPSPNDGTRGCNNYGPTPAGGTGGAQLAATGNAVASASTDLVFHVTNMQTPCTIVVLFCGTTTLSPGVQSGAGVRCIAGLQVPRPYKSAAGFNASSIDFPSASSNPNVNAWARSNSPAAGTTKHYYAAYRNPAAGSNPPCTPTNAFNLTNAGSVTWHL